MTKDHVHFDVCIGNPPYQMSDGGNNASAMPVYNIMIEEVQKLNLDNLVMIIPDRWFSGGRGLDRFRQNMINDDRLIKIVDYQNADECFPGRDISAGICYFHWKHNYHGPCQVTNVLEGRSNSMVRSLNDFPILVRSNSSISILKKVVNETFSSLSEKVSSQRPFGLRTYARPSSSGDLVLRWNKGKGPISSADITVGQEMISKWKVIVSRVFFEHAGKSDKDGRNRVLSILEVLEPGEVCSETYVVVDSFESEVEAKNLESFLKTKFARYLILQASSSIMINKQSFRFVPALDYTQKWSDEKLYKKYNLSDDEIREINLRIKEMG